MINKNIIIKLIISIFVPLLAGYIGSFFTTPSIPIWYNSLIKPSFTPPSFVFGPVWTILFILMGIAFFLVWKKDLKNSNSKKAIGIFFFQLVINILWSVMFFGLRSPLAGLIVIAVLWLSILLTIFSFYRISKLSAYLLVPYILWVSFASCLNYAIWTLN
ncbi:tryptophan-rich sensory protein [Candidatus Nomurabacteria bacterium]|nr:tryptophan-rich sensory protein [Candidatus Nomurabacteria bacterium]